jgi:DNA-binding transcriptional ArsR family regulator
MSPSRPAVLAVRVVCLTVAVTGWLRGGPVEAEETLAERRARIESMDAAGKEKLRRAQERFEALDPAEQEGLRELSKEIEAHAHCDELLAVMEQYCEWVNTLSVYERDALRELAPAERIEKIKEFREDQANRRRAWSGGRSRFGGERLRRLASKEEAVLGRWIDEYVAGNAPKLLEALPEPQRKEMLEELKRVKDDREGRRKLFAGLWMRWQLADAAALEQLRSELSGETREWLDKLPPEARRRLVGGLIGAFVFLNSQEELSEHLQKELTPEERDRLTNLPAEQARQQLWWYYVRSKWPDALPRFPEHRRGGRRPGGLLGRPSGGPPRPGFEPGAPPRRPQMKGAREGPNGPAPE